MTSTTPGVLETTLPVVEQADHVRLDRERIDALCQQWLDSSFAVPNWDDAVHWSDGSPRTANAVLLLDALNFCFWPDPGQPKWSIDYQGRRYNGYMALAASLKRAIEEGDPLDDADRLAELSLDDLRHIFRGENQIPMLEERLANAREVGQVLASRWEGQFARVIEKAAGSAVYLTDLLTHEFSSFRDVTTYKGQEVRLLKRAQICVIDLLGTFAGQGLGHFSDAGQLTAFADYKIPQVLEAQGALVYSSELCATLDNYQLIPPGDPREVEIRAGMVWAVEYLRQGFERLGRATSAYELDWFLWNVGQRPVENERPYHRTRTIYY